MKHLLNHNRISYEFKLAGTSIFYLLEDAEQNDSIMLKLYGNA